MIFPQVFARGYKKATSSASRVAHHIGGSGFHHLNHKPDDVARRAELPVLTRRGDLAQHVFVEVALGVAVLHGDVIDEIDDLGQQRWCGDGEAGVLHVRCVSAVRTTQAVQEGEACSLITVYISRASKFLKRDQRRSAYGRPRLSLPSGNMRRSRGFFVRLAFKSSTVCSSSSRRRNSR